MAHPAASVAEFLSAVLIALGNLFLVRNRLMA